MIVTRSELPAGLYDRWSKVFVYGVDEGFLQPNEEVVVEGMQRSSRGFYVQPPKDSYALIAKMDGDPVGSA